MSGSSLSLDRFATTVDHEGLVANAGLILAGTLMDRLGVSALIERWVRTGFREPGPQDLHGGRRDAPRAALTSIMSGCLRAGRTGRVLGFRPMAPSTVGTLRRTFTFGHIRQLEAVLSRTLARAWGLGAGPGEAPLVVDLDSTICEVHGKQKQGAAYGLHQRARLSPAARCTRRHRRGARRPHAQRLRRVVARRGALRRRARREPADAPGPPGRPRCAPDSGFWSRKLIDRLDATTSNGRSPSPSDPLCAQRSKQSATPHGPTSPTPTAATPKSPRRPMPPAAAKPSAPFASSCAAPASPRAPQQRLWPDWRHHAFNANTEHDTRS